MKQKMDWIRCGLAFLMVIALAITGIAPSTTMVVTAETTENTTITSMAYTEEGNTFEAYVLSEHSFGFRMPIFNGGANTWSEVSADLGVNIKVDEEWRDIDSVSQYIYNRNWGHWSDSGFYGFWFRLTEILSVQLYSKSNPAVTLEYELILHRASPAEVTALTPFSVTTVSANRTGTGFINFPKAMAGGTGYDTGADNLVAFVKKADEPESAYVNIDNNAASGWIYDSNFGIEQYGYWFKVIDTGSINVKLALKENRNIFIVYDITYTDTVRVDHTVYPNGSTTITANSENGSVGLVLPYLGGSATDNLPTSKELDNFVIEYYSEETGRSFRL